MGGATRKSFVSSGWLLGGGVSGRRGENLRLNQLLSEKKKAPNRDGDVLLCNTEYIFKMKR